MQYLVTLNNLEQTIEFAKYIAESIVPNFVVALKGDLGAGKTTLVRNILYSMGIVGSVKSPTYTLVEPYKSGDTDIYHFDLYRLVTPLEWEDAGFNDYFTSSSICFIEWAEKANCYIKTIDWQIIIDIHNTGRRITINSFSNKGNACLQKLMKHADD